MESLYKLEKMNSHRTAFFISDGTGITSEALGMSLLARFEDYNFTKVTLPYVDSIEKAEQTVVKINAAAERDGAKAIIFDTVVDDGIRKVISQSSSFMIDIFAAFLAPLEQELGTQSSYNVGRTRITKNTRYDKRIEAINYALDNDDGARTKLYDQADVILVGVSRSGKTPTCLYLAMQYGIKAANYPITEEDIEDQVLPSQLKPYREKVFGLTIEPERLVMIRNERKPNSRYASVKQCNFEVEEVELMYKKERIPFMNTTHYSVEEIATRIMVQAQIERRC
jgi:regulator of PEP synthase PpsR (kinase-PPPase family)|tara:strand:- start:389 stop:1234 length:846 start_codon:yes stop_codon:yes gene_type:complete